MHVCAMDQLHKRLPPSAVPGRPFFSILSYPRKRLAVDNAPDHSPLFWYVLLSFPSSRTSAGPSLQIRTFAIKLQFIRRLFQYLLLRALRFFPQNFHRVCNCNLPLLPAVHPGRSFFRKPGSASIGVSRRSKKSAPLFCCSSVIPSASSVSPAMRAAAAGQFRAGSDRRTIQSRSRPAPAAQKSPTAPAPYIAPSASAAGRPSSIC